MTYNIEAFFSAITVSNLVLYMCLGLCPITVGPAKSKGLLALGCASFVVIVVTVPIAQILYNYVLLSNQLHFMRGLIAMMLIATVVQVIDFFLRTFLPSIHLKLGIYITLVASNCGVLATALLLQQKSFLQAIYQAAAIAIGFYCVVWVVQSHSKKLCLENKTANIVCTLLTLGTAALALMGFAAVI